MERKLTYSDVCQAFENILENRTEEALLKALEERSQLEEKAERLCSVVELLQGSLCYCGEVLKGILHPEWAATEEEEYEKLKKACTLVEKFYNGLEDVHEYLEDPSSLSEEELSGVENLIKNNFPTLTKVSFLAEVLRREL